MKKQKTKPEGELRVIYDLCQAHFKVDLQKNTRKRPWVEKRAVFFLLVDELTETSYADMGSVFGKDHATVLHALKNVVPVLSPYHIKAIEVLRIACKRELSKTSVRSPKEDNLLLEHLILRQKYDEVLEKSLQMQQQLNNYPEIVGKVSELMMQLDHRERELALQRLETQVKVHRSFVESNLRKQPTHLDVIYTEV